MAETPAWKVAAAKKRESISAAIPSKWRLDKIPSREEQRDVTIYVRQFLSPQEVEITETDAVGIVEKTSTGAWKAEDVATAFCHRAALAHQLVSCLHEIFFDAAIASARELDAYYAEHKKPIGPLHGLPISLKDQFHVRDVETTMGYVGWIDTFQGERGTGKERVFESELVRELRALGAVLYVKTAVPHTLMAGETVNNIIDYTWNPKNRLLSSGGSSGGEGALIGLRGSPLGIGTDIGGSIRIPSAFNGLFGMRPSAGRFPYEGAANSMDGQTTILSVVGPLATSAGGLKLVTKSVLSQQPWLHDPTVLEIPWREEQQKEVRDGKKLVFGILRSDGIGRPQPPVRRALDMVVESVKKQGHEVIEWEPPSHQDMIDVVFDGWNFDGGLDVHNAFALSGETPSPHMELVFGDGPKEEATGSQTAALNVRKRNLQKKYMDYWNSTATKSKSGRPVDAVITPVAPFPAAQREKSLYYGYTMWINMLDYTAVILPVTTSNKQIDKQDPKEEGLDELNETLRLNYDPEIYDGAHVSVQLVGRRLQEEKMIAIADEVSKGLNH